MILKAILRSVSGSASEVSAASRLWGGEKMILKEVEIRPIRENGQTVVEIAIGAFDFEEGKDNDQDWRFVEDPSRNGE